jgi:hypothetical protein
LNNFRRIASQTFDGSLSEQIPSISTGIAVKTEFAGTRIRKKTGFISPAKLTWIKKTNAAGLFKLLKSGAIRAVRPESGHSVRNVNTKNNLPILATLRARGDGTPVGGEAFNQ